MWLVFLEMGLALGLAVFIVWWTWPKKKPGVNAPAGKASEEKVDGGDGN